MVLHTRIITGSGGGPDKTILNSPRFLSRLGYRCACAFLHPPGDIGFAAIRQRAASWGAPLIEIDDRGAIDWRVVPRLLEICREHRVDIWHAHDYKTNLLGLLLRRKHPMRLVTTVHGWGVHTPKLRFYYLADRWSLRRYDKVICVSEDLLHTCRRFGVAEDKTVCIENAIDTDQFRRQSTIAAAKERLGWPNSRYLIGAAGRLSAEKAFDVLIRAVADLVNRGTDIGLMIAGDGPLKDSLVSLSKHLGMEHRIKFAGFVSDLRPLYEAMDVFALSSLREGLPNVLLEAMALEVPIVATRVAGIPRLIAHGENGLLVDPSAQHALADAIAQIVNQDDLRARLSVAGRRTVENGYSFKVRMKKIGAVYDSLMFDRAIDSPHVP
jgi:glycosyltransferase involved in cell wall biosynthesis